MNDSMNWLDKDSSMAVASLLLFAVFATAIFISAKLSNTGRHKDYIVLFPLLALPATWSLYVLFNSLFSLALTPQSASWDSAEIELKDLAEGNFWRVDSKAPRQAMANISLYGDPQVNSFSQYLWQNSGRPVLAKPSLSDLEIAAATLSILTKNASSNALKDCDIAQPPKDCPLKKDLLEEKLKDGLAGSVSDARKEFDELHGQALYFRRVFNGGIQFATLYVTLLAISFWLKNALTLSFHRRLFSKETPLYDSLNGKPALFLKSQNHTCSYTDHKDGLTETTIPIRSETYAQQIAAGKPDAQAQEVDLDKSNNNYEIYLKGINDCVQKINGEYKLDSSIFHVIREVLQRASVNGLVDDAVTALRDEIEQFQIRVERSSAFLPFWIWLIPTIGFIGTINGISGALESAHTVVTVKQELRGGTTQQLTATLGIAFDTTLIALIYSIPLMFMQKLHEWRIDSLVQVVQRIVTERVIDGLSNAASVQARLESYDQQLKKHMKQIEDGLTKAVGEFVLRLSEKI